MCIRDRGRRINRGKGQRCTKTSDKDDNEEEDHRTRAPEIPPQREIDKRERRKENHQRAGEEQKFSFRGLSSPRKNKSSRALQDNNKNNSNKKRRRRRRRRQKRKKTHRRALARRGWHLHHDLFVCFYSFLGAFGFKRGGENKNGQASLSVSLGLHTKP